MRHIFLPAHLIISETQFPGCRKSDSPQKLSFQAVANSIQTGNSVSELPQIEFWLETQFLSCCELDFDRKPGFKDQYPLKFEFDGGKCSI